MTIRLFLVFAVLATLAVAAVPARASTLAWYRFGDVDTFGGGPINGGDIDETVNSAGTFPMMTDSAGKPDYSNDVPGSIYDPIADATVENAWSMLAPGQAGNERVRTSSQSISSAFSYETFVRFDDLDGAPTFAYHMSSASNGWALRLQSNDTIQATFREGHTVIDSIESTTAVTEGKWYHVGLIVTGNSLDSSDDAHLFIDYVNEASINLTDDVSLLSGTAPFYSGNVFDTLTVGQDESRYFDHALPLDGSQFLLAVPEPSGIALLIAGLIAVGVCARRGSSAT